VALVPFAVRTLSKEKLYTGLDKTLTPTTAMMKSIGLEFPGLAPYIQITFRREWSIDGVYRGTTVLSLRTQILFGIRLPIRIRAPGVDAEATAARSAEAALQAAVVLAGVGKRVCVTS